MIDMADLLINTDEMRFRIIDLEYKNLSEEELIAEIKKIYIEETGEPLPADIEIYHSSKSVEEKVRDSSYDGTIIYFHSEENDIYEMYVISQGTTDINDWEYNIKAMFAGKDTSQAEATDAFVNEVKEQITGEREDDGLSVIGLSHSLGHNNNTTAHLVYDTFDQVYSINGAQTNYYQLYFLDENFRSKVNYHFSLSLANPDAIYELDPQDLREFAESHYKEKANSIHQTISLDDSLYAVSGVRGFFTIGDVHYIDTNPDYPGLRELMDEIPDEVVRNFQELAIQYAVSSEKGGVNQAVYDILGVDMDFVKQFDGLWGSAWTYMTNLGEVDETLRNLNDNVPELMDRVTTITSNADIIFGKLEEAGYINNNQKVTLITEIKNIETELLAIQEILERNVKYRDPHNTSFTVGLDVGSFLKMMEHVNRIQESFQVLNQDDFLDLLQMIVKSHGIKEMLSAMSLGNKSYLGTDMILTGNDGNQEIRVNLSAALELYQKGLTIIEEKEQVIKKLDQAIEQEIQLAYKKERRKVMQKIDEMEASPSIYQYQLNNYLNHPIYYPIKIERINVNETIYSLNQSNLDSEVNSLQYSVERQKKHIEDYRQAVEALFEEDEKISKRFDLIRSV